MLPNNTISLVGTQHLPKVLVAGEADTDGLIVASYTLLVRQLDLDLVTVPHTHTAAVTIGHPVLLLHHQHGNISQLYF